MSETWYVMEDGSCGDPREIAADAAGILRHSDGRAVAYAPHGPRSRSIEVDESRRETTGGGYADREMKPKRSRKKG